MFDLGYNSYPVLPTVDQVEADVDYGYGSELTGTLVVVVPDYPAESDVKLDVTYGDGAYTGSYVGGTADYPDQSDVRTGVEYAFGTLTGSYTLAGSPDGIDSDAVADALEILTDIGRNISIVREGDPEITETLTALVNTGDVVYDNNGKALATRNVAVLLIHLAQFSGYLKRGDIFEYKNQWWVFNDVVEVGEIWFKFSIVHTSRQYAQNNESYRPMGVK